MGIQARLVPRRSHADVEKAPINDEVLYVEDDSNGKHARRRNAYSHLLPLLSLLAFGYVYINSGFPFPSPAPAPLPPFVHEGMKQCEIIHRSPPNPKHATASRKQSDRYVEGTGPVWLKNGTVWTGEKHGDEVLYNTDVWLEGGVIRKIGSKKDMDEMLEAAKGKKDKVEEVDLHGAWVTPGIVDMHSHLAVDPSPALRGSDSTNSWKMPVQPWLRSLDGFNTHDAAFNTSIAGGVTTMLVLPGSAGNIGGQAFTFKPRWTRENTPQSMQVDPPFQIEDRGDGKWVRTRAWRHIKHACGENPLRVYGNTRMDSAYDFRRAYNEGKQLKEKQERWCSSPSTQKEPFPESLEWEVLADVIRGNVKVNIHCYETVDLADLVSVSNEFQFPIAAFHHAHEAYLVPDLILNKTWGPTPPAVAIFANNARYKVEAYRGSPYAPKVLHDAGIRVSMKSDHPVLDSRWLMYEAAQAHAFGLEFGPALSSVISNSAVSLGLDHRLGFLRPGYDADVVVWDSFPLTLGATPKQTYIDGIPQLINPHVVKKPAEAQKITPAGKYDKEAAEAVAARGDPDLRPKRKSKGIVFSGVREMFVPGFSLQGSSADRVVVVDGAITCAGANCAIVEGEFDLIDLKGGSLAPGIITTGSKVGLLEITQEPTTSEGKAMDAANPLSDLQDGLLAHGVDGAQFGGKDELMAYAAGVTTGVTWPISNNLFSGFSYAFSTSGENALEKGAIIHSAAALHLNLDQSGSSVSSKIALLRRLLSGQHARQADDELHAAFARAAAGDLRLIVSVSKADYIASLVRLKHEVAPKLKLTVVGGHEAWLIADELAEANVGVIISPARSFPYDWDTRRILPGPPLTNHTLASYLASHGVKVGLGIVEECDARLTRFDAAWAFAAAPHVFGKQGAIDLVSANLQELLGLNDKGMGVEQAVDLGFVAYEGDFFGLEGRVRAVRPPSAGHMDLFE